MIPKQFRWILAISVSLLAVIACGQVSVGVITPTVVSAPGETPPVHVQETTGDSTNANPDSSPTLEAATAVPTDTPEADFPAMAYVGQDRNLWVLEAGSQAPRQLTFDANLIGNENTAVEYSFPRLSYDGQYLAYRQDVTTPSDSGYDFTTGTWVLNLTTGEQRQILDVFAYGMDWIPGTHQLTYGTEVDINYFMNRGQPDPALAIGLRSIDLDSGEIRELVSPERGYTLSSPNWSPDARVLAFTEVIGMEGSGMFAYYDFENQQYVAWDEPVGNVSWSPDGELLTYARHTYAASGEERLYLHPRQGEEQLIGPDYEGPAYATYPVFSPDGNQIAYLVFQDGPESQIATVMVLNLISDQARPLGQFEGVWELDWTPDGGQLVFSLGPWETPQIIAVNVADGSQVILADGSQPALAGW
jgi:dipeptidyl aminopeptidase/acylaminoacyl peptidase